eukprot:5445881-Prymnesium_polylepis.1
MPASRRVAAPPSPAPLSRHAAPLRYAAAHLTRAARRAPDAGELQGVLRRAAREAQRRAPQARARDLVPGAVGRRALAGLGRQAHRCRLCRVAARHGPQ